MIEAMSDTQRWYSWGFTLLELLVVIAILGILSAIGVGAFTSSQMKSRDSHRKTDLKNITTVLETFYNDVGSYPKANGGKIVGCGTAGSLVACNWDEAWAGNGVTYMATLPDDKSAYDYYYSSDANGTFYILFARLENTKDKDAVGSGAANSGYAGTTCATSTLCNYARSSSNASLPAIQ